MAFTFGDISNGQITSGIAIPGSGGYIDSIVAGQGTSVYATVSHTRLILEDI